jgi:ABC-type sugar transport system substrate-binding protein
MSDPVRGIGMVAPLFRMVMVTTCLLAGLCGCGRKTPGSGERGATADTGDTRVAILADNSVNPMRNYQVTLLERLIRTRPHMLVSTVHAGGDAGVQSRQVREAAKAHAAFLMVFPQDAAKLAPALHDVMAAGVRVFVFSADVPEDACSCAIFTDERRLGEIAGEYVVSSLKTKAEAEARPVPTGRVVMLRGDEESAACKQRAEGFLGALQSNAGIVLVHDAPGEWSEKSAGGRIREALRIQKQFDVVYAQNDLMALGAAKAVRQSNADARNSMLIVGTDGVPGKGTGISLVVSGELDATVYNPPLVDVAWREVQTLLDAPKTPVRKRIEVKAFMITPENAGRFQREGLPPPQTD